MEFTVSGIDTDEEIVLAKTSPRMRRKLVGFECV